VRGSSTKAYDEILAWDKPLGRVQIPLQSHCTELDWDGETEGGWIGVSRQPVRRLVHIMWLTVAKTYVHISKRAREES
jgi:hypothetical protein